MDNDKLRTLLLDFVSGEKDVKKKLTEERLNEISDIFCLIILWDRAISGSPFEKLIGARIHKVLREVSSENIPEWFMNIIQALGENFEDIARWLMKPLREKAKELYSDLSP